MAKLTGSVGDGGLNRKGDVLTVQRLINKKIARLSPLVTLVEDGRNGPATISAIKEFQSRVVGLAKPDGRVDTRGRTLIALNAQAAATDVPAKMAPKVKQADGSEPVEVVYGSGVPNSGRLVSDYAIGVVKLALQNAGMRKAVITSTLREPMRQARIMYDNANADIAKQYALYGKTGDKVIDVFKSNHKTKSRDDVIKMMTSKIIELNKKGQRTSKHVVSTETYKKLNIIDIGVNSTKAVNVNNFNVAKLTDAFEDLLKEGYIKKLIDETKKSNSCWHLEIVPGAKALPATKEELGQK